MEATGVYWKPVWNILDGQFVDVLLVNAQHINAVPGRKTDQKDSEWIADLLQHGLLHGFVPQQSTHELRELTRYRVSLAQECNRIANQIQKVMEDANLKLASVASDALGASGRTMLRAIIAGETNVDTLAEMAKGLLRNKMPAPRGADRSSHRAPSIHAPCITRRSRPRRSQDDHRRTRDRSTPPPVSGERRLSLHDPRRGSGDAWGLLSEIGFNMDQFPSAAHLASWAGMCPGNAESAGKRLSGKTRKGSAFLRRHLCQAGWAVSTKKNSYLSALFRRIARTRGPKRATMAVGHAILVLAFHLLKRKTT